jgi:hypothetical protein
MTRTDRRARNVSTHKVTSERHRSGRSQKTMQHIDLFGYICVSSFMCGGATKLHDLWVQPSTFDFGFVIAVYLAVTSTWIGMTIRLLVEFEWNRFLFIPLFAPTALIVIAQVMNQQQLLSKCLAGFQIAFAGLFTLFAYFARRDDETDDSKGGSA